jgi:uncharacterized protein YpmB
MNFNKLLKLAETFYALAAETDSLPKNSNQIKTILSNIEKLETYAARKKYAEKNLKHLSSGSARIVYLTPEKTVVKLAKNDKGIAQNKAEASIDISSKYLNKVLSSAKNNSWIEVSYLDKISDKEFKKMTGIDFEDFGECIRYGLKSVTHHSKDKPSNFDKVSESEIFQQMKKIGKKYNLMPGDIARISSWGAKDNNPVLIDAGLTKEVFDDYYASSSGSSDSSSSETS